MRSFLDAKAMAKTLRQELKSRNLELGHSECLEVVAKQFGFRDWNTMAVELERKRQFIPENRDKVEGLPEGWFHSGTGSDAFRSAVAPSPDGTGLPCFFITSSEQDRGGREPDPGEFCTIMQVISAEEYRGKRMAFKADLRSENARGSVTIWMRVDDRNGQLLAFDNREKAVSNGSIKGTSDWTSRQVILDIPEKGETINFGFYLFGHGKAWARALDFFETEEAANNSGIPRPKTPKNLDLGSRLNS